MKKNMIPLVEKMITIMAILVSNVFMISCNSNLNKADQGNKPDTAGKVNAESRTPVNSSQDSIPQKKETTTSLSKESKTGLPVIEIYNFHVTNRCASCIAIEEATTRTLDTYFSAEVKQGRIKRKILNVDEKANATISEKYQAFGSGLFVTRVYQGKETTTDLTGDGFKFARNKEDRFIEILKSKISEYLK
jgi:hypothetical protein